MSVGIVTNGLLTDQHLKLERCDLRGALDFLVISEEAGAMKPSAAIFEIALRRTGCGAREAVMVGDNWENDILGARSVGMRAVWLNRRAATCPDSSMATEITSLEPLEDMVRLLLDCQTKV